ncbi:hypothetical protein CHS0354_029868 [Potamilus streckersoni]|uniref:Uncharacterized protein n=1 Tax=Potamilus streckersoni TaxID=2493646 RepID=A0AAE0TH11_9BIVA|nr:hypothetical protein CHS0354_029868 [Potamilus streckersoni]
MALHIARYCPTVDMKHRGNQVTCFIKTTIGERFISETGWVNGREIMFVKDTASDTTLIGEDLADESCQLEGHKITLYTKVVDRKRHDHERTVQNTDKCEDEVQNKVVNNSRY